MSALYSNVMPALDGYFRPETVDEAVTLLSEYAQDVMVISGGTDLVNLIRSQAITPKYIVDIGGISGLDYCEYDESTGLKIGALATMSSVQRSKMVKEKYTLLHEAVSLIGSVQIRNKATVVGNICRASPSADAASPLLALGAGVKIIGPSGERIIPLADFFVGPGQTVLAHNEIVVEIQVQVLPPNTGTAFLKAARVGVDLAKVNVASVLTVKEGHCQEIRIALGAVAPTPIRARKAEELLIGKEMKEEIINQGAELAAGETQCMSDLRAPAGYREELCRVLVKRAIHASLERVSDKMGG